MSVRASLRLILVIALAASFAASAQNPKSPKDQPTKPPAATPAPAPRPRAEAPIPTAAKNGVPLPIERTRALASAGVPATALRAGRAVTYSADHLADNDGYISASFVNVFRRDGVWLLGNTADENLRQTLTRELLEENPSVGETLPFETGPGQIVVAFATKQGERYLVDFAVDAGGAFDVVAAGRRTSQAPVDGHVTVVVNGNGMRRPVLIHGQGFTFYYVRVIPIEW